MVRADLSASVSELARPFDMALPSFMKHVRLLEESGAAQAIIQRLSAAFGLRNIQYAMAATGLLVGLPMLYNAGFLVLIPLVYALTVTTRLPLVYLGLPLAAALSVFEADGDALSLKPELRCRGNGFSARRLP
mgnify:CR=1 FL=1